MEYSFNHLNTKGLTSFRNAKGTVESESKRNRKIRIPKGIHPFKRKSRKKLEKMFIILKCISNSFFTFLALYLEQFSRQVYSKRRSAADT